MKSELHRNTLSAEIVHEILISLLCAILFTFNFLFSIFQCQLRRNFFCLCQSDNDFLNKINNGSSFQSILLRKTDALKINRRNRCLDFCQSIRTF